MQVEVLTADLGLTGLAQFLSGLKSVDTQIAQTRQALRGLTADAIAAREALKGIGVDLAPTMVKLDAVKKEMNAIRDSAVEAAAATKGIGASDSSVAKTAALASEMGRVRDNAVEAAAASRVINSNRIGGDPTNRGVLDFVEGANASQLRQIYNRGVRQQFLQEEARLRSGAAMAPNLSDAFGAQQAAQRASLSNASELLRLRAARGITADVRPEDMAALRDLEKSVGLGGGGNNSILQRILGNSQYGIFSAFFGRDGASRIENSLKNSVGHGGNDFGGRGALFGLLPGGARPSQAALTTLLGIGVAGGPAVLPGALAAAPVLGAGAGALAGAAGTLKLAFDGITAAAFTTKTAFDALSPAQQQFVQTLRSLDAGLGGTLKQIAQTTLLPQLSGALHNAFSGAAVSSLSTGVGAFSNAIGGGAQQLGRLFGSSGFQDQFGQMLKDDAGYLRTFLGALSPVTDAFVRFQVSAFPLLHWLGQLTKAFATWVNTSIRADQTNGRLTEFFDILKTSLQVTGNLLLSVGHLAGAFVDAFDFQNSVGVVKLLTSAINDLANLLKQNSKVLNEFFAGAVKSAGDMLSAVKTITRLIHPLLALINNLIGGTTGWRVAIDALVAVLTLQWVSGIVSGLARIGLAEGTLVTETQYLRLALLGLGSVEVLGALALVAAAVYAIIHPSDFVSPGSDPSKGHGTGIISGKLAQGLIQGKTPFATNEGSTAAAYDLGSGQLLSKGKNGKWELYHMSGGVDVPGLAAGFQASPALRFAVAAVGPNAPGTQGPVGDTSPSSGLKGPLLPDPFTKNPLFGSVGTGWQLPLRFQVPIVNAQQIGSVSAQIAATKTAINYINAIFPSLSPANKIAAESQKQSLISSLQSLSGTTPTSSGNVLPPSYQTNIDNAAYQAAIGGSTKPEIAAVRSALNFVKSHIGGTVGAQRDAYAQAGTSLANQLASLLGTGASTSSVGFLPAGLQARLTAAQNATAGISGSTTPTSTTIRALGGLYAQLNAAVTDLTKQINANTFTGKQLQAAQAEQTTLVKQRAAAAQQLLNERTNLSVEHLLGIAGGSQTGRTAAASATSNLRTFLNETLHRFGLTQTGSGSLGPFVQELRKNGDINQRQYVSLEKILKSIDDIKKINGTVASGITGNISDRLAEIKSELQTSTGFGNAYVKDTIDKGVSGKIFERQSASLSNRGLIPRGGAALGVPYMVFHIHESRDPKATAREVHNILVSQARRNTTQYTGASAGTNQGLG